MTDYTIYVAVHHGEILCGFPKRDQCKEFLRDKHPEIDPFDVEIKEHYLNPYNPVKKFDR
jgi:hypothetical protein